MITGKGCFFMSRRAKIRWFSFLAAAAICFSGALAACFSGAKRYETRINADTGRALGAVMDAVDKLDRSLRKSACATTPVMESIVCTDIYSSANEVVTAMAVLPVRSSSLENVARHLGIVGDYAAMLSRVNAGGDRFSDDALRQLHQFAEVTASLHDALSDMQRRLSEGELTNEVFRRITDTFDNLEAQTDAVADTMESQMETIAGAFPEVPALVYEGAYSDHAAEIRETLEALKPCTEQEARAAAAAWFGCEEKALGETDVMEGQIPCYCFAWDNNGKEMQLAVTCSGCKVLWMLGEDGQGDAAYDSEQVEQNARQYLADHGFGNMLATEVTVSGGEARIRYASVLEDGIICYPEEITVTMSLTSGKVIALNAREYLLHHKDRDVSVFREANGKTDSAIPSFLSVKSVRPAILKALGSDERYCYEYLCEDAQGNAYQISVNAKTMEQEQILLPDEVGANQAAVQI